MIQRIFILLFISLPILTGSVVVLMKLLFWDIWLFVFDYMREFYAGVWLAMPETVRKNFLFFDTSGLLHNHSYLQKLGPKKMSLLSAVELSKYVNKACYKACKDKESLSLFMDSLREIKSKAPGGFNLLNATALGDIAYTALHHRNPTVRRKYSELLEEIKEHFISFK